MPAEVHRPVVEVPGEGRGVGGKIAQRVRRSLGIDCGRRAGIAQVVPHDVAPTARERLAERVGPREHRRAAREQNERRRRVAEVLDPERDAVGVDRCHHASPVAATPPDIRNDWTIGHIVTSMAASQTGAAGRPHKLRVPAGRMHRVERTRLGSQRWTTAGAETHRNAVRRGTPYAHPVTSPGAHGSLDQAGQRRSSFGPPDRGAGHGRGILRPRRLDVADNTHLS